MNESYINDQTAELARLREAERKAVQDYSKIIVELRKDKSELSASLREISLLLTIATLCTTADLARDIKAEVDKAAAILAKHGTP